MRRKEPGIKAIISITLLPLYIYFSLKLFNFNNLYGLELGFSEDGIKGLKVEKDVCL